MSTAALALELPGARKAAMFLMGIGDQLSVDIIRQLAPDEIRRINGEISALDAVPPEEMLSVFREFESMSASSRFFAKGGPESARRLIEQAMGKEQTQLLLDGEKRKEEKIEPVGPDGPFADVDPQELAKVLREENPQTLALILANLAPAQAGPLMASLPAETRPQVALRIALMDRISPDVFNRIAQAIRARLKASRQITRSNGDKALAAILNHMDGDVSENLLTALETENQSTVAAVRGFMFVFEDIIDIDKEGIKVLLARVDRKALTLALKGTSDKIKQHFTQCMSSRSSEMLLEDMEALGPVRLRDVAGAQQQIVGTIRQLEKEGAIATSRGGGGDEYVV
ncbi:MAG TPA: flagellar motor switch protein FliG [Bryobacteraceae bacterium]|nr:flagellar motor switch protein FliG [Bryobacteraceae bacterium]